MEQIQDRPTKKFYGLFQYLFDYYNDTLFDGEIKDVLIVITRQNDVFGHFAFKRWFNLNEKNEDTDTDELALNPSMFTKFPLIEICQTIVHEMAHAWQYHYGEPGRKGYHNKEWSDKMISIGLMPSDTGEIGGKTTGNQVADYPIAEGLFLKVTEELFTSQIFAGLYLEVNPALASLLSEETPTSFDQIKDFVISQPKPEPKPKSKLKYSCGCSNVWGKPGLEIYCKSCDSNYIEIG